MGFIDLSPRLFRKQLEVNVQHKRKFAAVRSTTWKYSFALLPLFSIKRNHSWEQDRQWGRGARHRVCREDIPQLLSAWHSPENIARGAGGCLALLFTVHSIWGRSLHSLGLVGTIPNLKNPILGTKVSTCTFLVWLHPQII